MKSIKIRHQFYLDEEQSQKLEGLARKTRQSKTAILGEAFDAYVARQGAHELDRLYGPRFDVLGRQTEMTGREIQRLRHELGSLVELTGLFIQHQLAMTAHHPPLDEETRRLGSERFRKFLEIVEKRLADRRGVPEVKKLN